MMNDVQFFTPHYDTPSNEIIRGERDDISHLPFHNVTWVSSHNSNANNFAAGDNAWMRLATNQKYSIYEQLKKVGVRGLMMDLEYNQNGGINLVHGLIEFGSLEDILNYEIIPFLEEDTNAIITIDFETLGDRALLMQEFRIILANTKRFASRIFRINDDRWANHNEWPTIQEMRDADQRVIILSDSTIVQSDELGIMLRNSITMENHWLKGLDKCSPRFVLIYLTNCDNVYLCILQILFVLLIPTFCLETNTLKIWIYLGILERFGVGHGRGSLR